MKVWKVLSNNGSKSGILDKNTQYALVGVALPLLIFTNGNIIAIALGVIIVFFTSYFVRKKYDGRSDWLIIWYRDLFKSEGTYNLNERDYVQTKKNQSSK